MTMTAQATLLMKRPLPRRILQAFVDVRELTLVVAILSLIHI